MQNKYSIHPKFKLNGLSFSKEDLKKVSYSLIKEGEPFEQEIGDFLIDWLNASASIAVKTSGSTGAPKTIMLQKKQMVNSAKATAEFFKLKEEDKAFLCLPASYIAGKMMLVRALVLGLELDYVMPNSKPLDNNAKYYDFCAMVPLQLANSLLEIKYIKKLIVGGAALPNDLLVKLQNTQTVIYETFGMTETITHVAARKCNTTLSGRSSGDANLFNALPNVMFKKDERGCLVIDAPRVSDELVVTNDLVELITDAAFKWLGRFDTIINSGGIKLIPEEIENKLSPFIENRFFVTGVPDEKLGERLVLIVEGDLDIEAFLLKLKASSFLKKLEVPKQIYKLPLFIETKTGKIRRKECVRLIEK